MLIQHPAAGGTRCIRQHEHGLLSGTLAHHWHGCGQRPSLSCVLAVAMHDLCWEELDRPKKGQTHVFEGSLPLDFLAMPTPIKARIYARGIAQMTQVDLWAGLLLNLHFMAFLPKGNDASVDALIASSARERERLLEHFGLDTAQDATLQQDFSRLKFFDLLSLYTCLTFGGAPQGFLPPWLRSPFELFGIPHHVQWIKEGVLGMEPWGFDAESLALSLSSRVLEASGFRDAHQFTNLWRKAPVSVETILCVPLEKGAP